MEAGGSGGESLGREDHAAAIETHERIAGKPDENPVSRGEETVHRSVSDIMSEFKHIPAQTQTKIGDGGKLTSNEQVLQVSKEQFDELLAGISASVAKSTTNMSEVAAETAAAAALTVDFKLSLLSGLIDELWDDMRQLVSTEPKFLATCMLTREPFAHHVSTLQFMSAVINRLGTWVPDFTRELRLIKEDNKDDDEDADDEEVNEYEDEDEEEEVNEYEEEKKAEEYHYASYRRCWGSVRSYGGSFEDTTLLSPMQFTHYMPGHSGRTPMGPKFLRTMQIYSIRVAETQDIPLEWPLKVYGVVTAGGDVDHRRNLLFLRTRDDCQILTKQDPFLHLTGPSRAIMSGDDVMIDVHLKLKGAVESKDRTLISKAFCYDDGHYGDSISTRLLQGLCTLELCCEHLEQSLQATILGVRVVQGSLPCESDIKVICSALPEDRTEGNVPSRPVLLLDSQGGTMPVDEEGYLELSRRAVSVKSKGRLAILMHAGKVSGSVVFTPESSNVSQDKCDLGDCELEITVAWSLIAESQHHIGLRGSAEPYEHELNPRIPRMKLEEGAC